MSSDVQSLESEGTDIPSSPAQKGVLKLGPPRNGKIAKLPKQLRDLVNNMLADRATGAMVIGALANHGVSLNHENVSNWKHGGFQDWLIEQEWQAEVNVQREYAFDMLDRGDPTKFLEAVIQLAITQIFKALKNANFDNDSSNYTRLLNALSRLAREAFVMKKHADLCARQKLEQLDPERQLTDKDRQLWFAKVEEMFRLKPGELQTTALAQSSTRPASALQNGSPLLEREGQGEGELCSSSTLHHSITP